MYYKSASETDFGCRGAISVGKAVITSHELDELRFDVSVGDCVWYLRSGTVEERERWVAGLEAARRGELMGGRLRRQGSAMSLSSTTYSSHSANSTKVRHQALAEKLAECETFKDILCRQIPNLFLTNFWEFGTWDSGSGTWDSGLRIWDQLGVAQLSKIFQCLVFKKVLASPSC